MILVTMLALLLLMMIISSGNLQLKKELGNENFWNSSTDNVTDSAPFNHTSDADERPAKSPRVGCGYSFPIAHKLTGIDQGLVKFGEFPWMVDILRFPEPTPQHYNPKRGGSIIHPGVVLTSARTVHRRLPEQLRVRGGAWDLQNEDKLYPFQEQKVRKVVQHSDFANDNAENSIALLFLTEPFSLEGAPHIGVACLGLELPPPGTRCIATSRIVRYFGNPQESSTVLRKVEVPIMSRTTCQEVLQSVIPNTLVHSSQMCAKGERQEQCEGEVGSPLVCNVGKEDNRFAQYGSVEFGLGCDSDGLPGVYTNIAVFREWISARIRDENLDPSSFDYQ